MHPHFSPLTHLDFAGDSTVDEGGFILLELGDLLLLEGDGGVDFGGLGFNEVDDGGLFGCSRIWHQQRTKFVKIETKPHIHYATRMFFKFRRARHCTEKVMIIHARNGLMGS